MVPGRSGEGDGDDEGCVKDGEVAGRWGLLAEVDEAAVAAVELAPVESWGKTV